MNNYAPEIRTTMSLSRRNRSNYRVAYRNGGGGGGGGGGGALGFPPSLRSVHCTSPVRKISDFMMAVKFS